MASENRLSTKGIEKAFREKYDLGEVRYISQIEGGKVNFNYKVSTNKSAYVFRILGGKQKNSSLEFKVLEHLEKDSGFPYKVPSPIRNSNNRIISEFEGEKFWIYEFIEGAIHPKIDREQLKKTGEAIATYHKSVAKLGDAEVDDRLDLNWLIEKYDKLKDVDPETEVDRFFLQHLEDLQSYVEDLDNKKLCGAVLPVHNNFAPHNLIFRKGELHAILDFDNVNHTYRAFDLMNAIYGTCLTEEGVEEDRKEALMNGYKEILDFPEEEESLIPGLLLYRLCMAFWWYYDEAEKGRENTLERLKTTVEKIENLKAVQ